MKTQTLKNRLSKIENLSKLSKSYQVISDLIEGTSKSGLIYGNTIRPCRTSGSGRFTTNLNYTNDILYLLNRLNIKYKIGNDSPRGGLPGNFIQIVTMIER